VSSSASSNASADVIVVGLGAIGSATAYQLASRGATVIGIDRYAPPHTMGSSHGATRITRLAIGEGIEYVPLVRRSHSIWRELERECGEPLYRATGGLIFGPTGSDALHHGKRDFVRRTIDAAVAHGIAHEVLGAAEIGARFPQFILEGDEIGYWEPEAGAVFPEACVRAQLDAARRRGATLLVEEEVLAIEAAPGGARVRTARASYVAAAVVVAAGPWLARLVGGVYAERLRVLRQVLLWFETSAPSLYAPGAFPIFIRAAGDGDEHLYGFPMVDDVAGVKVASEQETTTTDPDAVDRTVSAREADATYRGNVALRLRSIGPRVVRAATCLYTTSPDSGFVFDRHPEHDAIWIVSACSGHAFKHSAGLGEAIADRVLGRPGFDLSVFASRRFDVAA